MRTHNVAASLWTMAFLGLLFATCPQSASAQGIAGSFEQLQLLVRPGDKVTVTDTSGRESSGRISELSDSGLTVLVNGARQEFTEREVTTIRQRRQDSLGNGAVWGIAVGGALAGGLVAAFWEGGDSAGEAAALVAVYSGIGAGIGVGVDALITRRHVIYQRSAPRVELRVAPLLTPARRGAVIAVRF